MCGCLDKVNESLAQRNTMLLVDLLRPTRAFVATEKIDDKKRARPAYLMATYCPFCGEKYPEEERAAS